MACTSHLWGKKIDAVQKNLAPAMGAARGTIGYHGYHPWIQILSSRVWKYEPLIDDSRESLFAGLFFGHPIAIGKVIWQRLKEYGGKMESNLWTTANDDILHRFIQKTEQVWE